MIDAIVPIFNACHVLRLCLASLDRTTSPDDVRIICVLDGCDAHTANFVRAFASRRRNVLVVELSRNQGFVQACNAGFAESEGDLAVLVNSDTCATPGWVEKYLACFASDLSIGIASPLSNFCPHNVVLIQPGMSYLDMAELISKTIVPIYPDLTTCEGFFYAIRRECRREIGVLDAIFDRGYCEESDLSMRANYLGWRTVLVDNCYIFHHGRQTFGAETRDIEYNRNKVVFFDRWNPRFANDLEVCRKTDAIGRVRRIVAEACDRKYGAVTWVS